MLDDLRIEAIYDVLSPLGKPTAEPIPSASPLEDLKGKTIGFVWNIFTNGDVLADCFADLLSERFEDIDFVKLPSGKEGKWGEIKGPGLRLTLAGSQ